MITCELMGGLGNQLFQIATTLAVAWDNNDRAVFNFNGHKSHLQGNNARTYQQTIYRDLENGKIWWPKYTFKEKGHHYQLITYHPKMKLFGYFQSEKYFIKHRSQLLSIFAPPTEINEQLTKKYGDILRQNTCSIHVRRGDYLKFSNNHPLCSLAYYEKAISLFDSNTIFLIFSDDIDWCKTQFKGDRFIFATNNRDDLDLYLMSMCNHHIIANSSFSWWGSWLNDNPEKQIIAPEKWFGSGLKQLKTEDIYTQSMIII